MARNIEEWDRKATEMFDEAEVKLNDFVGKAKASAKGEAQQESTKTVALEARSEEVRVLYARVLAAQCLVDGRLDPREIEYLYVFMSRVGLGPDSREEVRRSLDVGQQIKSGDIVRLVEEVVAEVPDNEEEIAVSVLKDMTQVSWADGAMVPQEAESIRAVAEARFGERAEQVIELAAKTVEYEKALIKGDINASELEKSVKDIAAVATAAGVPITALFFSGSVVGLSAAGITSGLAALGLGGVLGLSAMVTGIGAVAVLGVAVYAGVRWLLGGRERELAKQRELIPVRAAGTGFSLIVSVMPDPASSTLPKVASRTLSLACSLRFSGESICWMAFAVSLMSARVRSISTRVTSTSSSPGDRPPRSRRRRGDRGPPATRPPSPLRSRSLWPDRASAAGWD